MKVKSEYKLVFDVIRGAKKSGNESSISYAKIAEMTGIQYTMVSNCIRHLVDKGYIERITNKSPTGGAKTNSYKIRKIFEA